MIRARATQRRQPDLDDTGLPGFTDAVHVASGATGEVLRMRQPALDRRVAVKLFSAGPGSWTRAVFDHEVAVTGRLSSHPCIVPIFEHGVNASGVPFIVLPWFELGSLADETARRGMLSIPETIRIGVRIAAALDHAHRTGVLHRDVKPANILLSDLGQAVLADFGGSLWMGSSPVLDVAHTPAYCAPEVLHGHPASPAADVWSLAAALLSALTGRAGMDPAGLSRPDVPPELGDAIASCMDPDPAARPRAMDLAVRLRQIESLLGLPLTEIPVPMAPPVASGSAGPATGDPTVLRPVAPGPARRSRRTLAISGAVAGSAAAGLAAVLAIQALPGQAAAAAPADGVRSVMSAAPAAQPDPAAAQPLSVRGVRVVQVTRTTVTLRWQDTNGGQARYRILVSPAASSGGDQVASTTTGSTITGLRPDTTYAFTIQTGTASVAPVNGPVWQRTLP